MYRSPALKPKSKTGSPTHPVTLPGPVAPAGPGDSHQDDAGPASPTGQPNRAMPAPVIPAGPVPTLGHPK